MEALDTYAKIHFTGCEKIRVLNEVYEELPKNYIFLITPIVESLLPNDKNKLSSSRLVALATENGLFDLDYAVETGTFGLTDLRPIEFDHRNSVTGINFRHALLNVLRRKLTKSLADFWETVYKEKREGEKVTG